MAFPRSTNQANPLWDFINSMQEQAANNPNFAAGRRGQSSDAQSGASNPWEQWGWSPFGPMPHRDRRSGGPHHHDSRGSQPHQGPPPSGERHQGHPPPPPPPPEVDPVDSPSRSPTPPTPPEGAPTEHEHYGPPPPAGPERQHHGGHHHGGPHHRGGAHHRGGPHGGPHGYGRGRRGGSPFGGPSHRGPGPFGFDFQNLDVNNLAQLFGSHLFPTSTSGPSDNSGNASGADGSFTPKIDVFDTATAYILHASLPGAKKSDIDVSYNVSKHSILISGVIARPSEVDEEMMSSLAQDERQVGLFQREIKLGEGNIDSDGISAKLEDGVLRVEVPKETEGWTEVKKVDIA